MADQEDNDVSNRRTKVDPNRHPRSRIGKTQKDRANGAKQRNFENKDARASWQGSSNASISTFPFAHCNGKRNRSVFTGPGNTQIRITFKAGGSGKR